MLSVSILYELRVTIITIIIISIIFLKTVVEHNYEKFFLIQSLKKLSIVSIITLLLQSFWLLPFLLAKGTSSSVVELANRSIFYSFVRLHNALTIHHPFWTSQKPVAFVHNSIPIIYSLIPILIISTLILYNQKKLTNKAHSWVSVWIIISLIGILLTKQNHAPFAGLYEFLYEHLPGFSLYRESTKFFLFTLLGYSALIVIGYDYWSKMISSRAKFKNFLLILVSVIYLVIPLTNIIPIFNGDFETMFTPRIKSNDYSLIEKKLNEDQFFYRTLWVPKDSRWTPDNNLHPKVSLTNVVNEDWSKYLDDPFSDTLFSKISNMMSKESLFESLIKGGSIKYVFVPIQDTANDDDFFIHYGGDEVHEIRNWYIKKLKEMKFLKEIDLGLEDVVAFENTSFSNYLDISNNIVNLDSRIISIPN
ncbi:MAG: hypothetical protein HC932_04715 [Thermales bacterium]|nr:hypothetical protein [Thermales bacterium]